MKNNAKSAFTMIEMLVVIGIIGILASVLLATFSGATGSARATQCEANIRNLANAAQTYAMREANGYFPAAGSFNYLDANKIRKGKLKRDDLIGMRFGWVSGTERRGDKHPGGVISFNETSDDTLRHALTNGAEGVIWQAVDSSRKTYQCPIHAEACRKATGRLPGWSYVMNQEFGYNNENSKRASAFYGLTMSGLSIYDKNKDKSYRRDPSRVLMFAELQGIDIEDKVHGISISADLKSSGEKADGVLNYASESIGFNHDLKRGRYAGHVAFADGHVEKIFLPVGGLQPLKLTEALCQGHELRFDGKKYEDLEP